jgi:hypothetical protein
VKSFQTITTPGSKSQGFFFNVYFKKMIELARKASKIYGDKFSITILDGKDFDIFSNVSIPGKEKESPNNTITI